VYSPKKMNQTEEKLPKHRVHVMCVVETDRFLKACCKKWKNEQKNIVNGFI